MNLYEKSLDVSSTTDFRRVLSEVKAQLLPNEYPVRIAVTSNKKNRFECEVGILKGAVMSIPPSRPKMRNYADEFNVVLLIPTGIGAEIGGHAGDAGGVARLIASTCDNLITHPNVVNASDIMELPDNGLYVEGSVITRLILGQVALNKVRSNRILLVIDRHEDQYFIDAAINAVSGARASLGIDCDVVVLDEPLNAYAQVSASGRAIGRVENFDSLRVKLDKLNVRRNYDAIGIASAINLPIETYEEYFTGSDAVNPWGGCEAILTHSVSTMYDMPSAHSPIMPSREILGMDVGIVDPRKAAEVVSITYLHCILKGLHRSPQLTYDMGDINIDNLSCLVIPDGCIGLPVLGALENEIPVIAVRNPNIMDNDLGRLSDKFIYADNYCEAAGILQALKSGISIESVKRPLRHTRIRGELCPVIKRKSEKENSAA